MAATTNPSAGSTVNNATSTQVQDVNFRSYRATNDNGFANMTTVAADWGYAALTASGSTTVKTGAGQLHSLIVATASSTIAIYDGTSANGNTILASGNVPAAGYYTFDVSFQTGLFVVLGGAAVATVTYR